MEEKKDMSKIIKTEFITGVLESGNFSGDAEKNLIKLINIIQNVEITKLIEMGDEITAKLTGKELNSSNPNIHLDGVVLTIIQDELNKRGGNPN